MRFDVVLALLVSTTWAMPEPLLRGTSDRIGSTLEPVIILYVSDSLCICLVLLTICSLDVPKIKHELKGFPEVHLHAVMI